MWLDAAKVLDLAGYTAPDPLPDPWTGREADAISYAERLISQHTGALFGSEVTTTYRIRLDARSYHLPLPADLKTVDSITPALPTGTTMEADELGLRQFAPGLIDTPWEAGSYQMSVTRGITEIPEDVTKAASLLAAHYLTLSDPDRSRYVGLGLGDFTGTMRLGALPVPEAEALLQRYVANVAVS